MFPTEALRGLGSGEFRAVELGGAPCLSVGRRDQVNESPRDKKAREILLALEWDCCRELRLLGRGEVLLTKGRSHIRRSCLIENRFCPAGCRAGGFGCRNALRTG